MIRIESDGTPQGTKVFCGDVEITSAVISLDIKEACGKHGMVVEVRFKDVEFKSAPKQTAVPPQIKNCF